MSGDTYRSLLQSIGAGSYVQESSSDEDLQQQLEAFASKCAGKACERIRQAAVASKHEPGIPFGLWLQEREENQATARQVLNVLKLPVSQNATKTDKELWDGLWQVSREENAWKILHDMVPRVPLSDMAERAGTCTAVGRFEEVASLIEQSSHILVLTGAGISASCGIKTYRDNDGFYASIAKEFGLSDPEQVNDIRTFRKDPLPWFKHIKGIVPDKRAPRGPSLTHQFIRALEVRGKLLRQYTQNIDTLEIAAGISHVTFCHGSFASATCVKCGFHMTDGTQVNATIADGKVPYCEQCADGVMKPDVVLFNEPMPAGVLDGIEQHTGDADLLLVLGTSLAVTPCSLIPALVGLGDAPRVLINAELAGRDSDFEHFLKGPSDVTVQRLLDALDWHLGDKASAVEGE